MRRDTMYADIQMKKLWKVLAAAQNAAANTELDLEKIKELCSEVIINTGVLLKEIEQDQKDLRIKAKVGIPIAL